MKILTRCMFLIHRILGTLLSVLFLVWFLSGLVMIYHTFPRVTQEERLAHMEVLPADSLPSICELQARLPEGDTIRSLTLNRSHGLTTFHLRTTSGQIDLPADPAKQLPSIDWPHIEGTARLWCPAPILRVDTLNHLEQWIPFGRLKEEFPIYKFHFDDPERHQLYISSRTGEVLQQTDRTSRFWGWLGPVPHWVYFTWIRQDSELWIKTVVWLAGIGCMMCIAGIYLGIRDLRIAHQRKTGFSPYRKAWYRWHHILGTLFGLFVLTFAFSGMMSLADVQDWGLRPKLPYNPMMEMRRLTPAPADYPLDYRHVLAAYQGQVKQLEWNSFGPIPFYTLRDEQTKEPIRIDATGDTPHPLHLNEEQIRRVIQRIQGDNIPINIIQIDNYETYYVSRKHHLPLPVYKAELQDVDHSCYYVSPDSGSFRYVNTPSRWSHWMYPALHSLNFPFLVAHPWLWNLVMWTLMLGGTAVSVTGVWLGIRYIRRKIVH